MDRRNQPVEFWGNSVTFWWRLWQGQLEQSLRVWGAMAGKLPQPSAAELAAEAESLKEISRPLDMPVRAPKASRPRKPVPKPAARATAAQRMH